MGVPPVLLFAALAAEPRSAVGAVPARYNLFSALRAIERNLRVVFARVMRFPVLYTTF